MRIKQTVTIILCLLLIFLTAAGRKPAAQISRPPYTLLGERSMSLSTRYKVPFVNEAMKKNILLNLAYFAGKINSGDKIDWPEVEKPFRFDILLHPQDIFAYHDDVPQEYKTRLVNKNTAHFQSDEGFVSDGYLVGDGVCHLASLINWAARDAGLSVVAPTNHDFAQIPEVPREYGVAIYYNPERHSTNQAQNLYIINNKDKDITLRFIYDGENLKVEIEEKA